LAVVPLRATRVAAAVGLCGARSGRRVAPARDLRVGAALVSLILAKVPLGSVVRRLFARRVAAAKPPVVSSAPLGGAILVFQPLVRAVLERSLPIIVKLPAILLAQLLRAPIEPLRPRIAELRPILKTAVAVILLRAVVEIPPALLLGPCRALGAVLPQSIVALEVPVPPALETAVGPPIFECAVIIGSAVAPIVVESSVFKTASVIETPVVAAP
jgi:hypothetical protein